MTVPIGTLVTCDISRYPSPWTSRNISVSRYADGNSEIAVGDSQIAIGDSQIIPGIVVCLDIR